MLKTPKRIRSGYFDPSQALEDWKRDVELGVKSFELGLSTCSEKWIQSPRSRAVVEFHLFLNRSEIKHTFDMDRVINGVATAIIEIL